MPQSSGLSSWATKTKGQLSTVGTAFNSAYGKAKEAITSPFSAGPASEQPAGATLATTPKTNSINPEVYVMTGQLNESTGDYKKALDSYSKALEIEPRNAAALVATARLYDRLNERDKAISFYQKSIEVSPTASTLAELCNLHAKGGNLNAAREELQKAIALEPKNNAYRSTLAGVLLDLGQEEKAMEELMNTNSPAMANYQMAYLHFTRKNVPGAQQYAATALQIDPNLGPARELVASIGGSQSLQNLANQGNQWINQAQSTLQQASAIGTNVQRLLGGATGPVASGSGATGLPVVTYPATPTTSVSPSAYSLPHPPVTAGSPVGTATR